jgi:hypothetical protein
MTIKTPLAMIRDARYERMIKKSFRPSWPRRPSFPVTPRSTPKGEPRKGAFLFLSSRIFHGL